MTKPEKRWQLLLVADDGRIIPFKRIKGIAVTLVILLVLLGLVCAGLGWQLTAEKNRHRQALAQLTDANRQVVHYKSEHELISAELVLAEARMEKAGLSVQRRQSAAEQATPAKTGDTQPVSKPKIDDGDKAPKTIAAAGPPALKLPPVPAVATPRKSAAKEAIAKVVPAKVTDPPKPPAVAMDDLEIKFDAGEKMLLARFRVKNTGPRSSPVAGRCVVVLKADRMDPGAWLAMPRVTLVNGKPDGSRGQPFKISRYRDMEIKTIGQVDPSSFKIATVYVYDSSGDKVLEKEFSIDLPAPKPVAAPAAQPGEVPETIAAPTPPQDSAPATLPVDQPTPAIDSGAAAGTLPPAPTPQSDAEAASPTDDPSLIDGVEPVKKEDSRSRF